jgi:hypothetical protein
MTLADREGDRYDWFLEATKRPAPERAVVIIRAQGKRRVQETPTESSVWETLGHRPALGTWPLELPRRPGRSPRQATGRVRARAVPCNGARRPGGEVPPGGDRRGRRARGTATSG